MLKSITYKATFSNGRTIENSIGFSTGLSAIFGPNESGKSLSLEMVRFGLFGTKALRGATSTYTSINVELDFVVREVTYKVKRTLRGAELISAEGEPLATGTNPVNTKVEELFGYGLTVFDMANSCNQGEIEALATMKPAERKSMVDNIIGLNALDKITEWLRTEANTYRNRSEGATSVLSEPSEPVRPDGYITSQAFDDMKLSLEHEVEVRRKSEIYMASKPADPGDRPVLEASGKSLDELYQQLEDFTRRSELLTQRDRVVLPQFTGDELVELSEAWKKHSAWVAYLNDQRQRGPQPKHPKEFLLQQQDLIEGWEQHQRHLKLAELGEHECPSCHHKWPVADELSTTELVTPTKPELDRATVERELRAVDAWEGFEPQDIEEAEAPSISLTEIEHQWKLLPNVTTVDQLNAELDTIGDVEDPRAEIDKHREFKMRLELFEERSEAYRAWEAIVPSHEETLRDTEGATERLSELQQRNALSRAYDAEVVRYDEAVTHFKETKAKIEADLEKASHYRAAADAMKEVRQRVKRHLVPSLSHVASSLITQMTGGQRNHITIDHDFNITVDGQSLNTLSGSGKAVANLAVRIGLGQVLTNRVFSVFMADEIDAAMDADRAGYTAECLRNLTSHISQIVLVSHKKHEADHHIQL